jgi:hypothetical protein
MKSNMEEGPKPRGKVLGGVRKALAVGLAAISAISGQEARPHPPLEKNNPQREYLTSRDEYLKKFLQKVQGRIDEERQISISGLRQELEELEYKLKDAQKSGDVGLVDRTLGYKKYLTSQLEDKEKSPMVKVTMENLQSIDPVMYDKVGKDLKRISVDAKEAFKTDDEQRDWLAGVVHSKQYEEKAMKNEGLPKEEVDRRRARVLEDELRLDDQEHPIFEEKTDGTYSAGRIAVRFGELPVVRQELTGVKKYQDMPLAIHEIGHAITDGVDLMSDKAKKLYKDSFKEDKLNQQFSDYMSSPTELDARKKVFEYELEKNGIWKYGEIFTKEHLEKALKLSKEGKLSGDSNLFLDYIKHEKIPDIMNTIASNQKVTSSDSVQEA